MPKPESRRATAARTPQGARTRLLLTGAMLIAGLSAFPASASSHGFGDARDGSSDPAVLSSDAGTGPGAQRGHSSDHGASRGGGDAVAASWSMPAPNASADGAQRPWSNASTDNQSAPPSDSGGWHNGAQTTTTQAAPVTPAAPNTHSAPSWASHSNNGANNDNSSMPPSTPPAGLVTAQAASASPPAPAASVAPASSSPVAAAPAPAAVHGLGGARRAHGVPVRSARRAPSGFEAGAARGGPRVRGLVGRGARRSLGDATVRRVSAVTTAVAPATRARPAAKDAPGNSPLVRTVTRIIHEIPAPLRPAVGILGVLALALAAAASLLILRSRRLESQRRHLAADVGLLESTLLPSLPERLGPAYVSTAYRPAEDLGAGGDFFDAFALSDQRTCLIVGDIAGHDRASILLTATVRYTLRAYLEAGLEPRVALAVASGVLGPRLAEQMATAVVAIYDGETGRLTYACAGHPSPVLMGVGVRSPTIGSSPLLGAGVPTGRRQVTVTLPPGASACFYTDGLIDPRIDGGRFGVPRLRQELTQLGAGCTAQDILLRVLAQSDEQTDDMTACVLRPRPGCAVGPDDHLEVIEFDSVTLERWGARFLEACGVAGEAIAGLLERSRDVIARAGTAVITIRIDESGSLARVDDPPSLVVPLPGRPQHTASPVLAASG